MDTGQAPYAGTRRNSRRANRLTGAEEFREQIVVEPELMMRESTQRIQPKPAKK